MDDRLDSILDEMRKMTLLLGERHVTEAAMVEYRKTLHDRFETIHIQMSGIDLEVGRLQAAVETIQATMATWRTSIKFVIGLWLIGSVLSAFLESLLVSLWHAG